MSKILVFIEGTKGKMKRSSHELLGAAKKSGQQIAAFAVGSEAAYLSSEVGEWGVSDFYVFKDSVFDKYNPELFTEMVTAVIQKTGAQIVLASASVMGKDLYPRVAARLKSGILSDCTDLEINGDQVIVKKPMYSGKCISRMGFENSPVQIVLMRANQLSIEGKPGGSPAKVEEMTLAPKDLKTIIKDVVKGSSEKLDLTEANVIVSGGRGLKEAGNFKLLNDLADALGATVGASRAVVDAGWAPHGMQVGQTGKTVAPSLYIAVGISGAIQHLAGMSGSKVIVAINNDPNAPIFQKSTYGIVGDLFDVVPKLTAELKKALN
jgi:electron transfer flavoprotein alpha subunit